MIPLTDAHCSDDVMFATVAFGLPSNMRATTPDTAGAAKLVPSWSTREGTKACEQRLITEAQSAATVPSARTMDTVPTVGDSAATGTWTPGAYKFTHAP